MVTSKLCGILTETVEGNTFGHMTWQQVDYCPLRIKNNDEMCNDHIYGRPAGDHARTVPYLGLQLHKLAPARSYSAIPTLTNGNGSKVSFTEYLRAPLGKTAVPVACKSRFGSSRYVSLSQITRFLLFFDFLLAQA